MLIRMPLTNQYLPFVRKIARTRTHSGAHDKRQTTYDQIMHILIYAVCHCATAVKQLKFK